MFTTLMLIAAWRVSMVIFMIFFWLELAFIFLTIGALAPNAGCPKAGGWLGLITAFIAWYGSAAVLINSTYGRSIFPVGPHHPQRPKAYARPRTPAMGYMTPNPEMDGSAEH